MIEKYFALQYYAEIIYAIIALIVIIPMLISGIKDHIRMHRIIRGGKPPDKNKE